jgi:hypothetical protein
MSCGAPEREGYHPNHLLKVGPERIIWVFLRKPTPSATRRQGWGVIQKET